MGHLANGNGGIGDGSRKRIFENCGFSDSPVLKFRKRRVSAIRDFPPGCGRNAVPINGRLNENGGGVEDLDGGEDAVVVESNSVIRNFPPGCEREGLEDNVKPKENGGVGGLVEGSDGAEDAVVVEQKDSYEGELPQVPKPLVHETTRPVEIMVPTCDIRLPLVSESVEVQPSINVKVEEETKNFPPRGRVSAVRDFPPGCGWGAARVNQKDGNKSVDASKNKDFGRKKDSGVTANPKQVEETVAKDTLKSKPIERKEAGVELDTEGELKKEMAQQVYGRAGGSKLKQENTQKSGSKLLPEKGSSSQVSSVSKKIDKPATGSVKLSKDVNYKRTCTDKFVNDSHDIKQSQEKPNFSLGFSEDRELVLSLVAKPKCPWVQGKKPLTPAIDVQSPVKKNKKTLKSPSSIPSSVEQGKKIFKSPSGNQSELENEERIIKSASASQLNVVERAGSQAYDDREIVQSLMAAPHCPWKHGKKPFKSPSSQAKKFVAK